LQVRKLVSLTILDGLQELFVDRGGGTLVASLRLLGTVCLIGPTMPNSILQTVAAALGAFKLGMFCMFRCGSCGCCWLIVGNAGLSVYPLHKILLFSFWESAGFGVNSFIFLLIGIEIDLITL